MHHPDPDDLLSVREAARRLGLSQSTLSRQVAAGLIRSHEGKVRLTEVLEDRANHIDLTRSHRRKGGDALADAPTDASPVAPSGDASADEAEQLVLVDGVALPFPAAKALKETYIARLRRQEFEVNESRLVDRATAEKLFFDVGREVRDAWLAWPVRVAVTMAAELGGLDARTLTTVLTAHVQQHLEELGEPDADLGRR